MGVRWSARGAVWACLSALVVMGCEADRLAQDPYEPAVRAVWSPSDGVVPTPTDLLRDPTTGGLALPVTDETPAADAEFRAYLNSLDGWPVGSTISIPVTGPVDSASLAGTLVLVRTSDGARIPVEARYDAPSQSIVAVPLASGGAAGEEPGLEVGEEYVYALWGYESGAVGLEGEEVIADAGFYLVRAGEPLGEHTSALPGETRAERAALAESLERVRLAYEPLYELVGRFGVPQEQIAALGRFSVGSQETVWFEPALGRIPTPNNLLLDRETGLVDLPEDPEDDAESAHIKEELSKYDGFATSAAIVLEATAPVDEASLARGLRVFEVLEGGGVQEYDDLEKGVLDDGVSFWVRPRLSFDPAKTYVYVATRDVLAGGERVQAQSVGALLRVSGPLVDGDGVSQVSAIGDASAAALEPARAEVQSTLEWLELEGVGRDQIAAAVPFRTASAAGFLMDYRAKLYEQDVPTGVTNALAKSPLERGIPLLLSSVETIVTGQITILDHLDPRTRAFREDGTTRLEQAEVVLTIPESATPGEPIKTVVFGHGLATSRELTYMIANYLAREGWAVISVDLPYHGERSVCLQDLECEDGFACDEFGACIGPSGERGELDAIESPFPDGPSYPATSGAPFIDLDHIDASRDHFIQSVLDVTQLLRVVRGADWAKASGGYVLDGDDVVYLGMSLGGILGAVLTTVEPTIGSFVLNVPGGSLFDIVENSGAFETLFAQSLDKRGITSRESDEYFRFENAIRWMLDPVDPLNISFHSVLDPFEYVDPVDGQVKTTPPKRVMIQMARGDSVVPNVGTKLLSERMGVPYREFTPQVSNHAFLFDPLDSESRRARDEMLEFYEGR